MALPLETGEWATNETSELEEPLESFSKEGYKNDDYIAHEHLNYFFNLYYRFMEAVKAGDATFSQKDSIQQLKDYDVSAINGGYFYVKNIGIYYFDGSKDAPSYNSSVKFKPTTPKTGNKGVYELLLPTPDSIFSLLESEFTEIDEINKNNSNNISTLNTSITTLQNNLNTQFYNFVREIGFVAGPSSAYTSISASGNQEKTFDIPSEFNIITDRNYCITASANNPTSGIIINWVKVLANNQLQVSLRNITGSSLAPSTSTYSFSIKEITG